MALRDWRVTVTALAIAVPAGRAHPPARPADDPFLAARARAGERREQPRAGDAHRHPRRAGLRPRAAGAGALRAPGGGQPARQPAPDPAADRLADGRVAAHGRRHRGRHLAGWPARAGRRAHPGRRGPARRLSRHALQAAGDAAYTAVAVQGAAAGARRVLALLDIRPDVADAADAAPLPGRARGAPRIRARRLRLPGRRARRCAGCRWRCRPARRGHRRCLRGRQDHAGQPASCASTTRRPGA